MYDTGISEEGLLRYDPAFAMVGIAGFNAAGSVLVLGWISELFAKNVEYEIENNDLWQCRFFKWRLAYT